MRQYLRSQAKHPGIMLIFRVGDSYELCYADAERAAPLLDIRLTNRRTSAARSIPMAGVPYHSAQGCLAKMVPKCPSAAIGMPC